MPRDEPLCPGPLMTEKEETLEPPVAEERHTRETKPSGIASVSNPEWEALQKRNRPATPDAHMRTTIPMTPVSELAPSTKPRENPFSRARDAGKSHTPAYVRRQRLLQRTPREAKQAAPSSAPPAREVDGRLLCGGVTEGDMWRLHASASDQWLLCWRETLQRVHLADADMRHSLIELPDEQATALELCDRGLWIGCDSGRVYFFDHRARTLETAYEFVHGEAIVAFGVGREDLVIGTSGGKLYRCHRHARPLDPRRLRQTAQLSALALCQNTGAMTLIDTNGALHLAHAVDAPPRRVIAREGPVEQVALSEDGAILTLLTHTHELELYQWSAAPRHLLTRALDEDVVALGRRSFADRGLLVDGARAWLVALS